MKIENTAYQYRQGNVGRVAILHRKMIPILVVKLSKLKAIYLSTFKKIFHPLVMV